MRTPGIEPGQRAWKALIITARSHPLIFFKLGNFYRHKYFIDKIFFLLNILFNVIDKNYIKKYENYISYLKKNQTFFIIN